MPSTDQIIDFTLHVLTDFCVTIYMVKWNNKDAINWIANPTIRFFFGGYGSNFITLQTKIKLIHNALHENHGICSKWLLI